MDLLHRYLSVVAIRLPERQRDDIVAELREELLSQVEEQQARLRRMLTTDEVVALLKAHGHPFLVAARYRSRQWLVGPELFPFYWLGLQLALGIIVLAHAFVAGIALVSGRPAGEVLSWSTGSLWIVAMYMTGVVTFSFFLLDRLGVGRWIGSAWSPRFLPPAGLMRSASVLRRVYDWAFVVLLAVWAVSALYWPILAARWSLDENAKTLPVWSGFGIQLMVAVFAQLVVHALAWVQPGGRRVPLAGQVIVKAGVLLVLAMFFRHKPWFEISNLPADLAERTQWSLHFAVGISLGVLAALALLGLALDAPRLARTRQ